MKLNAIKSDFIKYLNEVLEKKGEKQKISLCSGVSIFNYKDEFKEYLTDKIDEYFSSFDISDELVNDILTGETVEIESDKNNGNENDILELLTQAEDEEAKTNELSKLSGDDVELSDLPDDMHEMLESGSDDDNSLSDESLEDNKSSKKKKDSLEADEILKSAYKNSKIIKSLNKDKSGKLDEDEKKLFEEFINKSFDSKTKSSDLLDLLFDFDSVKKLVSKDGKELTDDEKKLIEENIKKQYHKDNLDNETLREALLNILKGDFKFDSKLNIDTNNTDTQNNETDSAENTSSSSQGVSSGGGGGGYNGGVLNSGVTPNTSNTVDSGDQLQELYSKRDLQEKVVTDAKNTVDKVFSDNKKAVQDAQNEFNNTKDKFSDADKEYQNAISDDSYLKSKEGKELQENILKNAENIAKFEESKNQAQQNISSAEQELAEASIAVSNKQTAFNAAKSQFDAIQNALNTYEDKEGESYDKAQSELNAAQISLDEATAALEEAKAQEEEAKNKLEENQTAFKNASEELANAEQEKETLDEKLAEVEDKLDDKTKIAKENYDKLKDKFDKAEKNVEDVTAKQSEAASKAKETLVNEQAKLDEINNAINEKEAEQKTNELKQTASNINPELAKKIDAKLGSGFCEELSKLAKEINCDPEDMLAMMYSESGLTPNIGGAGQATGLTQFLDVTAAEVGTTCDAMVQMSGIEQLTYIRKFFQIVKGWAGLSSDASVDAGTLYAMNFLPALAKNNILCSSGDIYYQSNYPLDIDGDGHISKSDLARRIEQKKQEMYADFGVA